MATSKTSDESPSEIKYHEFDINGMHYAKPRKTKRGGVTVYINRCKASFGPPRMALDKGRALFGLSQPMEQGGRKSVPVEITDYRLLQFFRDIDKQNIDIATENSAKWFKNPMSREVVKEFYKPIVNEPSKEEYSPYINIKLALWGNPEKDTKFWMQNGDKTISEVDESAIERNCEVQPMIELQSMWFVGKNFGMMVVATDLLIYANQAHKRKARCFDFDIEHAGVVKDSLSPSSDHDDDVQGIDTKRTRIEHSSDSHPSVPNGIAAK